METQSRGYTKYIVLAVIIIGLGIYFFSGSDTVVAPESATEKSDTSISTTTDEVQNEAPKTVSTVPTVQEMQNKLLQEQAYVDSSAHFSIRLPKEWSKTRSEYGSSTSEVRFNNGSSTLSVTRYARTDVVNSMVDRLGTDGFLKNMIDRIASSSDLTSIATSTVTIRGIPYLKMTGAYTGKISKKQATQYVYVALTPDSYYRIGIDAYTDAWIQQGEAIRYSVATFNIIP